MPERKKVLFMAALAAFSFAFLHRPEVLQAQERAGGNPNLSPAEARETIGKRAGDPGFMLLDVRTPGEFGEGRIEGAVLIDYLSPSFRGEIAKLDRKKSYLIYCRTGNRTNGALKVMREMGFADVSVIAGGITKWKEAGYPTAR